MILLDTDDYSKLFPMIHEVKANKLFARAVIELKIKGKIFVDNVINPATCYIIHPYGMTMLLGDSRSEPFNAWFRDYALNTQSSRQTFEWMQAFPETWENVLRTLFGSKLIKNEANISKQERGVVELNTRLNFKFNKERFLKQRQSVFDPKIRIVRTDVDMFNKIQGSVVPMQFFDSSLNFLDNGYALSLLYDGEPASTAFSSFWFGNLFEFGIETSPSFRNKGLAEIVCSALIDYCLQKQLEPVWACRKENTGSYRLALKLGFEVSDEIPYYRLSR